MSDNPIHLSEVPGAVRQACATVLSYAIARGAEYGRTEAGVLRDLFGLEVLRGSPPGDTPAPDGPWSIDHTPHQDDYESPDEWCVTDGFMAYTFWNEAQAIAVRDALNGVARGAAAGSSAPPECESCHALRNQLQTAQTKLRIRERGVREEPPAP